MRSLACASPPSRHSCSKKSAPSSVGSIDRRTPEIVIVVVAALLLLGGIAIGDKEDSAGDNGQAALPSPERVDRIEREVERIRGVEFKKPIRPKLVTPEEAKREAFRDIDETYPEKTRRADEELLSLLGLVPPDTDIRELLETVTGEQVIGYYDPRAKRMRIVSGNGADSPALVDITLAHELTHALEDQVFGLDEPEGGTDDESTAYTALLEGTASFVDGEFTNCCVDPGALLLGSFGALGAAESMEKLPPYIQRTLLFSYRQGKEFVTQLHRAGGWKLVNAALRSQPPVSTEQIIHPEKYAPFERPLAVKLRMAPILGDGWNRAAGGTLGEADTSELLRLGDAGAAPAAAAGWGGGSYELWQREGEAPDDCGVPCRGRDALVLGWRWDGPLDAFEFAVVLRRYVARGLKGKPAGDEASWTVGDGVVAMARGGEQTTLAWAPDAALARRLADRALVSPR
jgi:hypothetical protein